MSKSHLLLFALVCATFLLQQTRCSRVMGFNSISRSSKIPRTIRAPFRNTEMMTARGFGKRSQISKYKEVGSPWIYSKSDLDSYPPELDAVEQMVSESSLESFPLDWLVDELVASPVLTKAMLTRFVDSNKDGILTAHELLAPAGGSLAAQSSSGTAMDSSDGF